MLAIFLDLETTGLDPYKHRVIEIAFKIIDLSNGSERGNFQRIISQPADVWEKRDPSSTEVNGFQWDQLLKGISEASVAEQVVDLFANLGIKRGKAVFICQNPNFDRSFFAQLIPVDLQERLLWPYHWLDLASMYWGICFHEIQEKKLPIPESVNISKNEIAKKLQLPEETRPHRAMNGVDHLILCYKKLIGI
jgi:DNA polymerase-3 subunit epsilon/oligoribonuclease